MQVQCLEAANQRLEHQIQKALDRKCPKELRELDGHLRTTSLLQDQVSSPTLYNTYTPITNLVKTKANQIKSNLLNSIKYKINKYTTIKQNTTNKKKQNTFTNTEKDTLSPGSTSSSEQLRN